MRTTPFKRKPLTMAVMGGALLAASNMASAVQVTKSLEMICPFPLIGDQNIIATITADYPETIAAGEQLGPIAIDTITTVPDKARQGLAFVDATTITGTAQSINTFHTIDGNVGNDTLLTIEPTDVPSNLSGPFDVPAFGDAPAVTFTAAQASGEISLTVDDLILNLRNLKADGSVAPAPVGEFTSDCTLVEGQDNVLVVMNAGGGNVDPAEIDVDKTAVDFGTLLIGDSASDTVTVTNLGDLALGINSVSVTGPDAFAFVVTNDCTTLGADETCTIDLTYTASEEGAHTANLVIESTDEDEAVVTIPLSGTTEAIPEPEIDVPVASFDFGQVILGESASVDIAIRNVGTAALSVSDLAISGEGFSLTGSDCGTVPAAGQCTATVQFAPSSTATVSGTLVVSSDDADEPQVAVSLSGSGKDGGCDDSSVLPISLGVTGLTHLAASGGELDLEGQVDTELNLCNGEFVGDLHINQTQGSFEIIQGWNQYQATATVEFENVGQTVGTLQNGTLVATSQAYVKIPKVTKTLFGFIDWPIGGGEDCRTKEPVTFTVMSEEGQFDAITGGVVSGIYDLPELENCGLLTSILSGKMAGPDNLIELEMTPIFE
ncbi:hypothetical protein OLMES_4034 [Oleiphilus messinensis]|uniref:Choice-of-anchor D domain-containing protein n=2 Tax=Oleiphilus messinensis TaxID=141451 RepID=A0A1Y0IBY3_9GAMM|nr:hypothetical protein OLMES_4034 [Oleiphilus messinensis]